MMDIDTILHGDALAMLRTLPDNSIHCCVTSPPYFGLRDYGVPGQIGLESSVEDYVQVMVDVFAEVRRVLRNDGTCWLNLGDSYCTRSVQRADGMRSVIKDYAGDADLPKWKDYAASGNARYSSRMKSSGLKDKDLIGVPWRVAFALQAAGWWLRSDIIWAKKNCMPESVTDRPTRSHEYIFLLAKSERYYYDATAIAEPIVKGAAGSTFTDGKTGINGMGRVSLVERQETTVRNKRTVWSVATQPYSGAHFATFPPKLIEPCILASCPSKVCEHCGAPWERITDREAFDRRSDRLYGGTLGHNPSGTVPGSNTRGMPHRSVQTEYWRATCKCADNTGSGSGVVLDPFFGSGTVGEVAIRHSRHYLGIELNASYIQLAEERLGKGIQRVLWSAS